MTPEEKKARLLNAMVTENLHGVERYEFVALLTLAGSLSRDNPDKSAAEIAADVAKIKSRLEASKKSPAAARFRFEADVYGAAIGILSAAPGAGPVTSSVIGKLWDLTRKHLLDPAIDELDNATQEKATRELVDTWHSRLQPVLDGGLQAVVSDPRMGEIFSKSGIGQKLPYRPGDSVSAMVGNSAAAASIQHFDQLYDLGQQTLTQAQKISAAQTGIAANLGSIAATMANATADLQALRESAAATSKDVQRLGEQQAVLLSGQAVLLAYVGDELQRREAQRVAEERARTLAIAHGAADLLGAVYGQLTGDTKSARQISATANFAIEVALPVIDLVDALSKGKEVLEALTSAGSALLTGNFVGAALSLVTSFIDTGPTELEIVQTSLDNITKQISDFQQQMNLHFEHIDARLGRVEERLTAALQQLSTQIGDVGADVRSTRLELVDLAKDLKYFEREVLEVLQAVAMAPLLTTLATDVQFTRIHGRPLPRERFEEAEATLYSWAVLFSGNAVWCGGSDRDSSDGSLADQLEKYDLYANAHYTSQVLAERFGFVLPNAERVVNAHVWQLAAEGYARLAMEAPGEAQSMSTDRRQAVAKAISATEQTFQQMHPSRQDFSTLFDNYDEKLGRVDDALSAVRNRWVRDHLWDPFGDLSAPIPNADTGAGDQPPTGAAAALPRHMTFAGVGNVPVPAVNSDRRWLVGRLPGVVRTAQVAGLISEMTVTGSYFSQWLRDEFDSNAGERGEWRTVARLGIVLGIMAKTPTGEQMVADLTGLVDEDVWWWTSPQPDAAEIAQRAHDKLFVDGTWRTDVEQAFVRNVTYSGSAPPEVTSQRISGELAGYVTSARADIWRAAYAAQISGVDDGGGLPDASRKLQGALLLIRRAVMLALPASLARSDSLRAAFLGMAGLLNDDRGSSSLRMLLALGAVKPEEMGDSLVVSDIGRHRLNLARDVLARASSPSNSEISQAGTLEEVHGRLALTRSLLDAVEIASSLGDIVSELKPVAKGERGASARRVQGLLRAADDRLTDKTLVIDGVFGEATERAVKIFQKANGLNQSGAVDSTTWRRLLGL